MKKTIRPLSAVITALLVITSNIVFSSDNLPPIIGIYEAENATQGGSSYVSTRHKGYSGTGFVDYINNSNDYIEWKVDATVASPYALRFGYAMGKMGERPLEISVNNQVVSTGLNFPTTGSWSNWNVTEDVIADLNVGMNTIRATAIGSSGANVDYLEILTAPIPIADVENTQTTNTTATITLDDPSSSDTDQEVLTLSPTTGIYEAENATQGGSSYVSTRHKGYSGTGFVDYINNSNDYIEWKVDATTPSQYAIRFGYALGKLGDRVLEISVNNQVVDTKLSFPPTGSWENWRVTEDTIATLKAGANVIRATAIGSSGANIDYLEVHSTDTSELTITGTAKTTANVYENYSFLPVANKEGSTFSIVNKPAWALFETSTGRLTGSPALSDIGINSDIRITTQEGSSSAELVAFSIEVKAPIDIAHMFGKATQGSNFNYKNYSAPEYAIDMDYGTSQRTSGENSENWLQIEIPRNTNISEIMVKGRSSKQYRLSGTQVYILQNPYTGSASLEGVASVGTLLGNDEKQMILFSEEKAGSYILLKSADNNSLHVSAVEVYGKISTRPEFLQSSHDTTIDKWRSKFKKVVTVLATDYQGDTIAYRIDDDVPFRVDNEGNVFVNGLLNAGDYSFNVVINSDNTEDLSNSNSKTITISVVDTITTDTTFRTNDDKPKLTGYLPNIYNDGDNVTIKINNISYTASVNNDGMWFVDNISSALDIGFYDVTLIINSEEVVYPNYFEVYRSRFYKSKHNLTVDSIEDINVSVASFTTTPLETNERVRGSSISLEIIDGVIQLENKSFQTIKSLIGQYINDSGERVYVRLIFDELIQPYSSNVLTAFDYAETMEIVITANLFDMQISFGGTDCVDAVKEKTRYCIPTNNTQASYSNAAARNNEQEVYSTAIATYHHLYNSINGLNTMQAWVYQDIYEGVDYKGNYQSINNYIGNEDKESYLYRNFIETTKPNHHVQMRSMRYRYAAEGMAGTNWASVWEGSIKFKYDDGRDRISTYDAIHHEMMHGIGKSHYSGMTYGWSHALKQAVSTFYTVGENPIVHAPKYILDTQIIANNQLQITVHKTNDAISDELTFEMLSSKPLIYDDFILEQKANDAGNQVTLSSKELIMTRLFLRVYGEDSQETMTQILMPVDRVKTLLFTDAEQVEYHAISHEDWVITTTITGSEVKTNGAYTICRSWFGDSARIALIGDASNSDVITAIQNASWLTSKRLLGQKYDWRRYLIYDYSDSSYDETSIARGEYVTDDKTLGILCVVN